MPNPFLTDLAYALHLIRGLLDRAEERLPREIQLAHWIEKNHGPNSWAEVAEKFPGRQDVQAAKTLTEVMAQLQGLISDLEKEGTPPDLRLGRMRRSS